MNVDTFPRTLLVAGGVALFCSAMVSLAVYFLRPLQVGLQSLERNRAILVAADLLPPGEVSDRGVVSRYLDLDAQVVDLDTGWFTGGFDAHAYDHWRLRDEGLAAADDPGADGRKRYVPVYLVRKAGSLQKIVLPVDGSGIRFIAMAKRPASATGFRKKHGSQSGRANEFTTKMAQCVSA